MKIHKENVFSNGPFSHQSKHFKDKKSQDFKVQGVRSAIFG